VALKEREQQAKIWRKSYYFVVVVVVVCCCCCVVVVAVANKNTSTHEHTQIHTKPQLM